VTSLAYRIAVLSALLQMPFARAQSVPTTAPAAAGTSPSAATPSTATQTAAPPATAPAVATEAIKTDGSEIGLTIVGAIVHKDKADDQNVALIKEKSGSIKAVKKDFVVMEKYKVIAIREKYIELITRDAKRYLVYQNKFRGEFASTSRSPQTLAATGSDYFKEDGFERTKDRVKMSAAYRDKLVTEDMAKILMQATAEPFSENGAIIGFQVSQIDKGSIYDKGGLLDGDVITQINGTPLNSVGGAIAILKSLKGAETIEFELQRDKAPLKIVIEVN
jgi:type II secretory pathway component PulC